jgi:16S rRNA (guanine1207-N2)-methyltransferase
MIPHLKLERVPSAPNLQAWDSADQYLLRYLEENNLLTGQASILTLNEAFGALSVSLAEHRPVMLADSYLSHLALLKNLSLNQISSDQVKFIDSLSIPDIEFDLILIKIPKSLALLEYQLYQLRSSITKKTTVIAAGMSRHIHNSTLTLFEKILGPTKTTLAWKKSRLILPERDFQNNKGQNPYPDEFVVNFDKDYTIASHASVFSRERLDAGTRLLLENMPSAEEYRDIIDLGCGNGLLGLIAASVNPGARLTFVDESFMAVKSARMNFERVFKDSRPVEFKVTNCLEGVASGSVDLILNNPPFHQQHNIGDAIAWQMFIDSRRVLRKGAELIVVGNRHLGYHAKLKKIFGHCEQLASNGRYVVLKASRKQSQGNSD